MKHFIVRVLINGIALMMTAALVEGIHAEGFMTALVVALLLGIINAVIRPIFLLLTLPINIMTLGLFTLVINGFMLKICSFMVNGFYVGGFISATFGALILAIVSAILSALIE